MKALVEICKLTLELGRPPDVVRPVENLDLAIGAGETLGLVGESGCGKTVTALSLARLLPASVARYLSGQILIDGRDVLKMSRRELRGLRGGRIGYVFQEPGVSLNPVMRVGRQVLEALRLHRPGAATRGEVIRLLSLVGIPAPEARVKDYPHQLSGGMQQRVMIAMALAPQPKLLVADEPTTALDVTIQAQILDLLRGLKARLAMSILLITHNLGLVSELADRLAVMYAGQIVETGPASALLRQPLHPYSRALLAAMPTLGQEVERLPAIAGTVPHPGSFPAGCRFHPRCQFARPECQTQVPGLIEAGSGRAVRCPYFENLRGACGVTQTDRPPASSTEAVKGPAPSH